MADSVDTQVIAETIVQYLDVLGFKKFLKKYEPTLQLNIQFFDRNFDAKHFRSMMYFLFVKLYGSKAVKAFRAVFPARDIQQETEFKKICTEWLDELSQNHPEADIGKVLPIIFLRLTPSEKFLKTIYRFVLFVAQTLHGNHMPEDYDFSEKTLQDCHTDLKETIAAKDMLVAKYQMVQDVLVLRSENVEQWMLEAQSYRISLQMLPSSDEVRTELDSVMKNFTEISQSILSLPVMDQSIDFGENWDYNLTHDRERVVVNRVRDCFTLLGRFIRDPKRFSKELKHILNCERMINLMAELNRTAEERIKKIQNEQAILEAEILSSDKAKAIREELEGKYIDLDVQQLIDCLDSITL